MISAAVWVSSNEAKFFKFNVEGVETKHLHESGPVHHSETDGMNHKKEGGDTDKFLHQVAEEMVSLKADRWLVVGSGVAKTQLKHLMEKKFAKTAEQIVGVVPMEKSTDGEIKDFAHVFFKKEGVFEPSMKLTDEEKKKN
ncbi:hypothetical protein BH10BDE1_BH10BDE1_27610 [soil metagenome]